jgi:nicotinate phosphoribosyltransferase
VIEFGTRRAHGTEAGLFAARAAYIGGCAGTSNVEAGHLFGIPTFGTLAHSFVMSFEEEDEAFRAFLKVFPQTATILVDTYDTIAAVKRLASDFATKIPAVRLDSGDLCELSKQVRQILDEAEMTDTKIFVSGDLNEYRIGEMIERGARIDSFGVGTELATSHDASALGGVYKLAGLEVDGHFSGRIKLSHDKSTYPGTKQVWRCVDQTGKYTRDLIALADEPGPGENSRPLLESVMKQGDLPRLDDAVEPSARKAARFARLNRTRERARQELQQLPESLLALDSTEEYRVDFSERLATERDKLEKQIDTARR